jgi:hypothetical protein
VREAARLPVGMRHDQHGHAAREAVAQQRLHARAASEVTDYFQVGEDGSFTVDTVLVAARPI